MSGIPETHRQTLGWIINFMRKVAVF
jgi:hypothetical protein